MKIQFIIYKVLLFITELSIFLNFILNKMISLQQGHYTTYCNHLEIWHHFNDSR